MEAAGSLHRMGGSREEETAQKGKGPAEKKRVRKIQQAVLSDYEFWMLFFRRVYVKL